MRNGGDRTSRVAVNRKIPVLSEAQINTDEVFHGDRRSTGGEMVVPIVQRLGSSGVVFDFSVGKGGCTHAGEVGHGSIHNCGTTAQG